MRPGSFFSAGPRLTFRQKHRRTVAASAVLFSCVCKRACEPGSVLTAIYLDLSLPAGSSHLPGTAGPAICPSTVLLRIEFTGPSSSQSAGELLPRLFALTPQAGRYISVALVLKSPSAGVTRYPCPVEPGLSSRRAFRRRRATVCLPREAYCTKTAAVCQQAAIANPEEMGYTTHVCLRERETRNEDRGGSYEAAGVSFFHSG